MKLSKFKLNIHYRGSPWGSRTQQQGNSNTRTAYAPINVNSVGGGECGQGVGIWQILKFFDQIPQGGKRQVNQKCQKSPHPRGKKLNKQYYNTI